MKRKMFNVMVLAAALGSLALGGTAYAQEKSTVKILVGFPPGGSADVVARLLAERLRTSLDQNVRRKLPCVYVCMHVCEYDVCQYV